MIEKYVMTGTTVNDRRNEIYNWLKNNAEGFVFDSVTLGENVIECYKNENKVLRLLGGENYINEIITVSLYNGRSLTGGLSSVGGGLTGGYSIKASNGIFLHFEYNTRSSDIFVTNEQSFAGYGGGGTNSAQLDKYFCGFFGDRDIQTFDRATVKKANLTSFVPLCSDSNYPCSELLFCTLHSMQSGQTCELVTDSDRYVYDGFFAMKE